MNAKQKAVELFNKFYHMQSKIMPQESDDNAWIDAQLAKQCAIIVVDEILKSYEDSANGTLGEIKYWAHVKIEISSL